MPAAMHRGCDILLFCAQKGEEAAAPAEAAFPAEPSALETVPDIGTVLGYSPQLQLTLHRSNFAGMDDGDDSTEASNNQTGDVGPSQDPSASAAPKDDNSEAAARGPGRSSSATLSPLAAANGVLHPDSGSKAGSSQVDWRIGLPEGLCVQADRLESQRQLLAPTDTAQKKASSAESSAENRAFFGTVGHLYASARVELIRLAAALSLHSNFSPTKRVGSGADDEAEPEQTNGLSSPERAVPNAPAAFPKSGPVQSGGCGRQEGQRGGPHACSAASAPSSGVAATATGGPRSAGADSAAIQAAACQLS